MNEGNVKTVARNVMEGFLLGVFDRVFLRISPRYTANGSILPIHLTEPQGKIKRLKTCRFTWNMLNFKTSLVTMIRG